jgi:tetratricopeptide (TPR) repeat protein
MAEAEKNMVFSGWRLNVMIAMLLILLVVFTQVRIDSDRESTGLSTGTLKSSTFTFLELLGGLKTASAAFLWLKVDRIHDTYYGNLKKEEELVPMYRLVTWLNPHLDEAYYVGSYMLYKFGKPAEGWKFNQEGLRMNPRSGKLELNAAQFILFERGKRKLKAKDYKAAVEHLKRALTFGNMEDDEFLIAYHDLKLAYDNLGLKDEANATDKELNAFIAAMKRDNALQQ